MLRPNYRGDAGENRHNSIIKDPPAFEDNQKLRGLLKLSSDAFSAVRPSHLVVQMQLSLPYSASESDLQPPTLVLGTPVEIGPKLLQRSYPNPTQKKLPFLTSDSIHTQILHTITEKSKHKGLSNVNSI
jgi:hypothetical protein